MLVALKGLGLHQFAIMARSHRGISDDAAQTAASGGRPIRWYFAEPETEAFAKKLFEGAGGGRARIETQVLPWPGSGP
jgi:hypothetical protein